MTKEEFEKHLLDIYHNKERHNMPFKLDGAVKGSFPVLCFIHNKNKEGVEVTPGMLSEKMNVSTARIARLLNTLEEKEYIIRKKSISDQRVTTVSLSEKGNEIVSDHTKKKDMAIERIVENISDDELNDLFSTINKICDLFLKEDVNV